MTMGLLRSLTSLEEIEKSVINYEKVFEFNRSEPWASGPVNRCIRLSKDSTSTGLTEPFLMRVPSDAQTGDSSRLMKTVASQNSQQLPSATQARYQIGSRYFLYVLVLRMFQARRKRPEVCVAIGTETVRRHGSTGHTCQASN
jgi:hypothetical protein